MSYEARTLSVVSIVTIALLAGCSSGGPARLTLHPTQGQIAYAQNFSEAYCSKSSDGSYTCVLVADDKPTASSTSKSSLQPANKQTPLRQVVHINVLWRPLTGTRDAAISNATIDWYVLSNATTGNADLLLYQGSGYVTLKPGDDTTAIDIRNADLRPAMVKGSLTDPIGTAMLSGKFLAINDNQKAHDLVNATRQRTAEIASSSQ